MRFKTACLVSALVSATAVSAAAQEVEEVIVTAQKREQNLQEVPITVSAATAEMLQQAGATGTRDLTLVTPGLNFSNQTATGSPNIRGVGTRGIGPGDEPSVPIYIDGVYQSTTHAGFFEFNNIERVEVLKGPQGTLFGRNALGGAINIITLQPSREPRFKADASYGSDNEIHLNAYVSGPLGEKLAGNIAFHHDQRDGYIENIVTGEDKGDAGSTGARAKLLWTPTDRMDLTVGVNFLRSHDDTAFSGYPLGGNTVARRVNPNVPIAPPGKTGIGDTYFNYQQVGAFANLNWDFDGFQLTALQSWLRTRSIQRTDSDATILDYQYAKIPYLDESQTTEVRLASTGVRKVDWLVGANYYRNRPGYVLTDAGDVFLSRASPTGATLALISELGVDAYAVFGEATYHVNDALSVTGGIRYSHEKRTKDYRRSTTPFASLPTTALDYNYTIGDVVFPVPTTPSYAKKDYEDVSFRASVQYDFAPRIRGFVTFSQGFKSGFFNASSGPPFLALKPETVDNWEVGLKTDPTSRLRLNITAFHMTYKNLQVSARSPTGAATTDVFNAAEASNYGGEVQFDWIPVDGLTLRGGLAYQHARYDDFPAALVYFPATSTDASLTNPCQPGTGVLIGGNRSATCDASGKPLARSPDWTANLAANYEFDAFGGKVELGALAYWSDNFIWDFIGQLDNDGDYTTVNAHASWATMDERVKVTLFARNLFDSDHPMNRYQGAAATYAIDVRPRTIGVRLAYQMP
ncbi:TonB-dependent receptor [Phenylobacterium zucineum HLK1]|uniref:TonB-dependent receptor n=1 Tax=Phenylobacterium zucineum (strain HLK1) TaxID=450851 RepID=B4RH13_PHEZH|nr:TonB-dependent receptor [Phenylobacterium zucineum]ACG78961.1 TonB-dependent receptor [Phenylobacterium zucineum HLK1]